ncbi:NADPH-dependent FMN reductase [Ahrensia sp. R2A130]|uniref:NADPH-dependent FMN reductase n=1 Tax=Ahrensia sp. R2A130 TaxID=744979 RepID=UPI0001E0CA54|nr:NAD(P)H-dependent oxidoreductase [Ahrensia sp. R2A130]EFL87646.1 NADPH-dependent fmn reductase [Ahrensia sp. R2A130]
MSDISIAILPGSTREASVNRQLAKAFALALQAKGVSASVVEPADYPLAMYSGDDEANGNFPEKLDALAAELARHQAVILVSPEYNACTTPLLKNIIDWLSREKEHNVYERRIFALAAASPGGLGGIRCLSHLRDMMVSIGADTLTAQLAVSGAGQAFNDEGHLTAERPAAMMDAMCDKLIASAKRYA